MAAGTTNAGTLFRQIKDAINAMFNDPKLSEVSSQTDSNANDGDIISQILNQVEDFADNLMLYGKLEMSIRAGKCGLGMLIFAVCVINTWLSHFWSSRMQCRRYLTVPCHFSPIRLAAFEERNRQSHHYIAVLLHRRLCAWVLGLHAQAVQLVEADQDPRRQQPLHRDWGVCHRLRGLRAFPLGPRV
jgi:hypothetical protein